MNCFRRRLGERCADILDWLDYRPDANFWPFFAIPPILSVTWAYAGPIGLGLVLGMALALTLFVAIVTGLGVAGWLVANALRDALATVRLAPRLAPIPAQAQTRQRATR